jgi:SET domain-containing protein
VSTDSERHIDPRYACFRLRVAESKIHRWGIYAEEKIPKRRKVIEYTGEKISRRETLRRANSAEFNYLFTLDQYWTIDGSVNGSGAQWINHCCEPNLEARIVQGHILYFALRDIKPGEELTIDYRFPADVEKYECNCGAAACRGTINLKRERKARAVRKGAKKSRKRVAKKATRHTA